VPPRVSCELARERDVELAGAGTRWWRRRLGREAVLGQESCDGVLGESDLEPSHRPATSGAGVEVGAKHVPEQPPPKLARRGTSVGVIVVKGRQLELVTWCVRRAMLGGVVGRLGNDLRAQRRVARKDLEITDGIKSVDGVPVGARGREAGRAEIRPGGAGGNDSGAFVDHDSRGTGNGRRRRRVRC
jgi:hypothetical protein